MTARAILASVAVLLACEPGSAAAPVCALLDPEKTPQAALLEAKLLADPAAAWVERASIDAVLKEQKLQAAFGPQGVGDRVKLGKLLKADLLVFVRPVKGVKEPALELIVSETAGGLRLLVRGVAITKDSDSDVAALQGAVREGIKKHGEKIKEVIAVPPFVNNDLELTSDHMKGAYAKLAEAEAFDRKGVVVVELAEAEALAKELALAGGKLDRPLPVYLLGEFRHDGNGKDRTVTVKLRAERGGKATQTPGAFTLKPEESGAAVRKWSAGLMDRLASDMAPRPPSDPKTEAKQLAERARAFARLGYRGETVSLLEAAILLDPESLELRVAAIAAIRSFTDQDWQFADRDLARVQRAMRAHRRGLDHLEFLVHKTPDIAQYRTPSGEFLYRSFLRYTNQRLETFPNAPRECREVIEETQRLQREMILRIIGRVSRQGKGEEETLVAAAIAWLPPREKYELLKKLLAQLRDLPNPTERAIKYSEASVWFHIFQPKPDLEQYLDWLSTNKDEHLRAAGVALRKKLATDRARMAQANKPPPLDPNAPRFVSFQPVALSCPERNEAGLESKLSTLVAAGPGIDVLVCGGSIYIMKEKGKVRLIWDSKNVEHPGRFALSYDGRYVWASTILRMSHNPILLVIDPVSERVWDVDARHGVPQRAASEVWDPRVYLRALAIGLSPGRACVCGTLGGRTWVGIATFNLKDGPRVKVIHEAKEVIEKATPQPAIDPKYTFEPMYMLAVQFHPKPDAKEETRILLGRRDYDESELTSRPLWIDPDRQVVELSPTQLHPSQTSASTSSIATAEGVVYFSKYITRAAPGKQHPLTRVAFPGGASEEFAKELPRGDVLLQDHDGRLIITVQQKWSEANVQGRVTNTITRCGWWQYDPVTKSLQQLLADGPEVQGLAMSSHYGLVSIGGAAVGVKATLNAVTVAKPLK